MTRDKILFIISFACLGLLAAFLFSHNRLPPPQEKVEQVVEEKPKETKQDILSPDPDKVIVPFQLTSRSAIAQFLVPGTYVDVRFTSKSNFGFETVSLLLFKTIRILGIGKDGEGKSYNEKGVFYKPNMPVEILLELSPEQSEILSYAEQVGHISFDIVGGGVSYEHDELVSQLLKSTSDENFNSILVTHMILSLFPGNHVKVIAGSQGYIVSGIVNDAQTEEHIIQILDMMAPKGEKKNIINLMQKHITQSSVQEVLNIPSGQLAVPFELNIKSPIVRALRPGVTVDVNFTSKPDIGITPVHLTLFKNLYVLAVHNAEVESGVKKGVNEKDQANKHEMVVEVLLQMTPDQAEIFSFALASGLVSLELTRSSEYQNDVGIVKQLLTSKSVGEFQSILVTYMIRSLFPGVNVSAISTFKGFILKGTVPDPQIAIKITEIFTKLVPGGERAVISMLDVQPQQVLLCVKFYELTANLTSRVGVNWKAIFQTGGQLLGFGAVFPSPAFNTPNYIFEASKTINNWNLSMFLDMLEEDINTKILAEPNLTTISGETAHFFAGGEFPILIPQGGTLLGTVTVDFKKFGVSLDFTPIVDLNGLIALHVVPEVSDIDRSLSVVLNGFVIPGVRSRKADTTVKLWPGQSYLIAGLYLDHEQNTSDNLYGLNKIPIIGSLFGSNDYRDERTELLIIVTPYLIQGEEVCEDIAQAIVQENEIVASDGDVISVRTYEEEFLETSWETPDNYNYSQYNWDQ